MFNIMLFCNALNLDDMKYFETVDVLFFCEKLRSLLETEFF